MILIRDAYSPGPLIRHPDNPEPMFPGMPHDVHRAIVTVIKHAGSLSAAGALLTEYALMMSQK